MKQSNIRIQLFEYQCTDSYLHLLHYFYLVIIFQYLVVVHYFLSSNNFSMKKEKLSYIITIIIKTYTKQDDNTDY